MPTIPFIGGHYQGRSPNINAQETINLFPVLDQEGGKAIMSLVGCPGLVTRVTPVANVEVRGMRPIGDYLYAVCGSRLYRISKDYVPQVMTGTLGTSAGRVFMEDCGTYLMITDGNNGYYHGLTANKLNKITDADFPLPSSLTYQDGYFIVSKRNTGQFYQSTLYDPRAWDALKFATAEGRSDPVLAVLSDHRELWLYGKESTEVWANTGGGDFAFTRVSGGFNEWGLGAVNSPSKLDNGVIWLTNNWQIVRALDYTPKIVSTRQIEYKISQYSVKEDAIGFSMIFEGHAWYYLSFPSEGVTWVYDASTNLWHQRTSFINSGVYDGTQGQYRANCYALFNGKHLVGDYGNGKIYEMRSDVYADDGEPIRAVRTGQVIENQGKWGFFDRCEADVETGVGLEPNLAPQIMVQFSRDGGHTWGVERWASLGKVGEYGKQAYWNKCGRAKSLIPRIIISDPVKRHIAGLRLNVRWE